MSVIPGLVVPIPVSPQAGKLVSVGVWATASHVVPVLLM
jgi:hypothetical protein